MPRKYEARLWKDKSGSFQIRARYLEQVEQIVRLRATEDGRVIEVGIDRLPSASRFRIERNCKPRKTIFWRLGPHRAIIQYSSL